MARGERGGGTRGGKSHGAATDSEAAHDGRPGRPRRFLKGQAEVPTPFGPALVALDRPAGPARSLLVLGHGAGGGVDAPDLLAVRAAVLAASVTVARVTQPYRVRGRRAPAPAGQLDEAWTTVVSTLSAEAPHLILGGRSSGARVACRTARALGAAASARPAGPVPGGRAGHRGTHARGQRRPRSLRHARAGPRHRPLRAARRAPRPAPRSGRRGYRSAGLAGPSRLGGAVVVARGPGTSGPPTSQAHPGPGGAPGVRRGRVE